MILPIVAVIIGLVVLVWSADRFVDGAVGIARFMGMSTLLIGIIIVGFGTSAPEMVVSALSALQNNPELALGNAYGSNVANIALILGVTALISPIPVKKSVFRYNLPVLLVVTALAVFLVYDGCVSRLDSVLMLGVFWVVMALDVIREKRKNSEGTEVPAEEPEEAKSIGKSVGLLLLGLVLLVVSSRALVWGAVEIARTLGVSDLVIGLTIVAVGTSLPELASSIAAARKGEHDLAIGNVIGSNLFNTLMVVGIAGFISPMNSIDPMVVRRDMPIMVALTVLLLLFGLGRRSRGGRGRINRVEGLIFLAAYVGYLGLLIVQTMPKA